jgi:pantoate--beta-alanine ligase
VIYRALCAARDRWEAGERRGEVLHQTMVDVLATEPQVRVDYASAVDAETFQDVVEVTGSALLCVAAALGRTRLIDNLPLVEEPIHRRTNTP